MLITTHWGHSVIYGFNALYKITRPANHRDTALEACNSTDLSVECGINGLADALICTAASKMALGGYTAAQLINTAD